MRLIRFGEAGNERPGLLNGDAIVDLRRLFPDIPDVTERFFAEGWLDRVRGVDKPGEKTDVRIGPPVARPSKIICLGKNYVEHAREGGMSVPERPLLFAKAPTALTGPFDPIRFPRSEDKVDFEVELAVIIGRRAKRLTPETALSAVAGFSVMNDVSGRTAQFGDKQWFRGKSFDTFAPLGPALVTPDEAGDITSLALSCTVDGAVMQDGTTADMLFSVPEILAFVSEDITLLPGDVIATGTPAGVGIFRDPPRLLAPGETVECRIETIGAIRNTCVAPD